MIQIKNVNAVFNRLITDPGILRELSDEMTFLVPGYQHMPAYKGFRNKHTGEWTRGYWDGKIKLIKKNQFYYGLNYHIEKLANERGYPVEYLSDFSHDEFSSHEALQFSKTVDLPFDVRDYQLETFTKCVRQRRGLVLSPTASGKSLIIYLLVRYYDVPTLVVVPLGSLVHQMEGDFRDYGYTGEAWKIWAGKEKLASNVTVSTWQSIYQMPKDWFNQFGLIIIDEAHHAQAKSLTGFMEQATDVQHRFGFTGTLDDSLTHQLVLEGLFGPIIKVTTSADLMRQKFLSALNIKCIELQWAEDLCKIVSKLDYNGEVDWLVMNKRRNEFIKNLALSLKGNSLVLFRLVDKHGIPLYNMIKEEAKVPVHFVSGMVDGEEREVIRKLVDANDNSIIVASLGVFSTGTNIVNLNNIVLATPIKSKIKVLQSIGRGLRRSDTKTVCNLIDIGDNLTWRGRPNTTLKHFKERVTLYIKEGFDYKIYPKVGMR